MLQTHFLHQPQVYVAGDMFLYFKEGDPRAVVALALPAVEAADESADGIAHEEEELLANRYVSQPDGMTMQVHGVREPRPVAGVRLLCAPDGVLDGGAAGLADVEEMHGHGLCVARCTRQASDSAPEP